TGTHTSGNRLPCVKRKRKQQQTGILQQSRGRDPDRGSRYPIAGLAIQPRSVRQEPPLSYWPRRYRIRIQVLDALELQPKPSTIFVFGRRGWNCAPKNRRPGRCASLGSTSRKTAQLRPLYKWPVAAFWLCVPDATTG